MKKIVELFKELMAPFKLAYTWPLNEDYSWYRKFYTGLVYLMRHSWRNKSPWTMFIVKISLLLCGGWYDNFDHFVYFLLGIIYISIESWFSYMDHITLSNRIKNKSKAVPWTIVKQGSFTGSGGEKPVMGKEKSTLVATDLYLFNALIELFGGNKRSIDIKYEEEEPY